MDNIVDKRALRQHLKEPIGALRENEVIAFPTETVYGLGGNAFSSQAIKKIFSIKGRPADNPLILHIGNINQLDEIVTTISATGRELIERFWPGPLTLILPSRKQVVQEARAGLDTVAVRMPSHPIARLLLEEVGLPIAAPSANLSGRPSPTLAKHVWDDLYGKVYGIIDGGRVEIGIESTVLDLTHERPRILRPGSLTAEELRAWIPDLIPSSLNNETLSSALSEGATGDTSPISPGMKYTHYAPRGELYLVRGNEELMIEWINNQIAHRHPAHKSIALLAVEERLSLYKGADMYFSYGSKNNIAEASMRLYEILRQCDEQGADIIYSEGFSEMGIGAALMNRLEKAAGGRMTIL